MWNKTPPCADCENQGCGPFHDVCEKFKKWKAERPDKEKDDIFLSYKREQKDRRMHRESRRSNPNKWKR